MAKLREHFVGKERSIGAVALRDDFEKLGDKANLIIQMKNE